MRALRVALVSLLVCGPAAPALAGPEMSAAQLRTFCSAKDESVRRICSVYILGVVEGLTIGVGLAKDRTIVGIPDNVPEAQLVAAFMRSANALAAAFPKDLEGPAAGIVAASMQRAYPCARTP